MATVFGKTYRTIKSKLYSKRLIEIEQTVLNVFYLDLHQHAFKWLSTNPIDCIKA